MPAAGRIIPTHPTPHSWLWTDESKSAPATAAVAVKKKKKSKKKKAMDPADDPEYARLVRYGHGRSHGSCAVRVATGTFRTCWTCIASARSWSTNTWAATPCSNRP